MAGVTHPPVSVNAVAELLGFTVLAFGFPDHVSAVTFVEEDVKSIGVNSHHSAARRRFTVAHELGHYLCGHHSRDRGAIHVEDCQEPAERRSRQEIEADEFAMEILMPEPHLLRDLDELGLDVPSLARRYQVTEHAMWLQLISLNATGRAPST